MAPKEMPEMVASRIVVASAGINHIRIFLWREGSLADGGGAVEGFGGEVEGGLDAIPGGVFPVVFDGDGTVVAIGLYGFEEVGEVEFPFFDPAVAAGVADVLDVHVGDVWFHFSPAVDDAFLDEVAGGG